MSRFELLLSEISATYINLPIKKLEKVLKYDFERLTRFLGFDGCILYINSEPSGVFRNIKPLVWFIDEKQESNRPLADWLRRNSYVDLSRFSYLFETWNKGAATTWSELGYIAPDLEITRKVGLSLGIKSSLSIPILFEGSTMGVLTVCTTGAHRTWPEGLVYRLRIFGEVFINALMRKQSEEKLQNALSEIKELKKQLEEDYHYVVNEINVGNNMDDLLVESQAFKKILLNVKQVAPTDATVLILGETGTGKGIIARTIHNSSLRKDRPLMQVNCASFSPALIESELFGHERGAFTGAVNRRLGRFETAKGTSLFLDEIGDLPFELQPKLLRVLEEGEFERVGGSQTIKADVRIIAATHRDLEKEVSKKHFRHDLWYRLSVFPVLVPPLRERPEDIPAFIQNFIGKHEKWKGERFDDIQPQTIKALQNYYWPGNVRELRNVVERGIITAKGRKIEIEIPSSSSKQRGNFSTQEPKSLREVEREAIITILQKTNWKISGPEGAAQYLDIHPETLRSRIRKLNIKRSPKPIS